MPKSNGADMLVNAAFNNDTTAFNNATYAVPYAANEEDHLVVLSNGTNVRPPVSFRLPDQRIDELVSVVINDYAIPQLHHLSVKKTFVNAVNAMIARMTQYNPGPMASMSPPALYPAAIQSALNHLDPSVASYDIAGALLAQMMIHHGSIDDFSRYYTHFHDHLFGETAYLNPLAMDADYYLMPIIQSSGQLGNATMYAEVDTEAGPFYEYAAVNMGEAIYELACSEAETQYLEQASPEYRETVYRIYHHFNDDLQRAVSLNDCIAAYGMLKAFRAHCLEHKNSHPAVLEAMYESIMPVFDCSDQMLGLTSQQYRQVRKDAAVFWRLIQPHHPVIDIAPEVIVHEFVKRMVMYYRGYSISTSGFPMILSRVYLQRRATQSARESQHNALNHQYRIVFSNDSADDLLTAYFDIDPVWRTDPPGLQDSFVQDRSLIEADGYQSLLDCPVNTPSIEPSIAAPEYEYDTSSVVSQDELKPLMASLADEVRADLFVPIYGVTIPADNKRTLVSLLLPAIIGIFIAVIALILYFILKNKSPQSRSTVDLEEEGGPVAEQYRVDNASHVHTTTLDNESDVPTTIMNMISLFTASISATTSAMYTTTWTTTASTTLTSTATSTLSSTPIDFIPTLPQELEALFTTTSSSTTTFFQTPKPAPQRCEDCVTLSGAEYIACALNFC